MADTKKYLHNLDVVNNKVMNLLLNPLTTAQRTTIGAGLGLVDQGYVCYDTTLNQQYFWDGTQWIVVGAGIGPGTTNYLPKWDALGTDLIDSQVYDDGTYVRVGIGGGSMGFPYEKLILEAPQDMKFGAYTSVSSFGLGGASYVLGYTNVTTALGYYPGFEFQMSGTSIDANNFVRYNFIQRDATGTVVANNTDLFNLYADARASFKALIGSGTEMVVADPSGFISRQAIPTGTITGSGTATQIAFWDTSSSISSDTNLYWDNSLKRLGISTATPNTNLDVNGWINAGSGLSISGTTWTSGVPASGGKITFVSNGLKYEAVSGAGFSHSFFTNGLSRLYINDTGVGIGTTTPGYILDVLGLQRFSGTTASNEPTIGSELVSTGWTSTDWTGSFGTGWIHTVGFTTPLTNSFAPTVGQYYYISWTVTGRTAGTFQLTFGGQTYYSTDSPSQIDHFTTNSFAPKATTVAGLVITPTSNFNGTITISVKQITTASVATTIWANSSQTSITELRANNQNNLFLGNDAGKYNKILGIGNTGLYNVGVGPYAFQANSTGWSNTAIGSFAMYQNTTGFNNIGVGGSSLQNNISGNYNVGVGGFAIYRNTTGQFNTALGYRALYNGQTASFNTAVGYFSSNGFTTANTGQHNATFGHTSYRTGNGSFNTMLGSQAGYDIVTGDSNIFIGYNSGIGVNNSSNNTIIGSNITIGTFPTGTNNWILLADGQGNVRFKDDNTNTIVPRLAGLGTRMVVAGTNGELSTQIIPAGGTVTGVTATAPLTSSGGTTPDISTSMNTNKLIGRSTAGVGVMEEITVGTGLSLSAGTLTATATGGGLLHGIASGTDTYTVTIAGAPTSYSEGDAYIIRFTNGNTTGATLNINGIGTVPLYRNNDGGLIGGDITANGDMLCVYDTSIPAFRVIGTSPNSLFAYVTNDDSVTITKGQAVYAFGGTGDRMTVKLANNTGDATSAQTVGLVFSTSIAANQKGLIMMQGLLDGLSILPTATWSDGDPVYLDSVAGGITPTKPYAPNHLVYLGIVTTASNGSSGRMYVKVQNGYELDELHNVQAQSPTYKDTLWYDNTVSPAQWKTASISTILGYTPFQLPSLTSGSVLFSNGTTIAEDNANFFWDNTNKRLGIGTTTPSVPLQVSGQVLISPTTTSTAAGALSLLALSPTISPTSTSSTQFRSLNLSNTFNAPTIAFNSAAGIHGAWVENRILNSGAFTADLIGASINGIVLGSNAVTMGSVSNLYGIVNKAFNSFSNTVSATVTNAYGYKYDDISKASLTITSQAGLNIPSLTSATNNTSVLLGTTTIPSGNWSIYNADANKNYFNGNTLIGTTTDAGYKLDINGTSRIVTSLETPIVRGNTTSGGTLTLQSTSNATKGKLLFGTSAYDEVNNRLGIGTATPTSFIDGVSTANSGSAYSLVHTQTALNAGDVGDACLKLDYNISGSGAGTELVTRTLNLYSRNNWITGTVTNMRVFNLQTQTGASSNTTQLDQVYLENVTGGTVTNFRAIHIANSQGTSQGGLVMAQLTGTNRAGVSIGSSTLPSGVWSIYSSTSDKSYHAGNFLIGTTTDAGYKLDVNGTARFSNDVTAATGIIVSANAVGAQTQFKAGIATTTTAAVRLTNGGSNIIPEFYAFSGNNTVGTISYGINRVNGFIGSIANTGTIYTIRTAIQTIGTNNIAGSESGDLAFYTQQSGAAIAERVRILASGFTRLTYGAMAFSMTVGTNAALNTYSSYRTTNGGSVITPGLSTYGSGTAGQGIYMLDGVTGGGNGFVLGAFNSSSITVARAGINITNLNNTAGSESGDLIFLTQSGGIAMSEKMRITGTGFVGINSTSPANTLDVIRGSAGAMGRGVYETASFSYNGDMKFGLYTASSNSTHGAGLSFGQTNLVITANNYYPGFDHQYVYGATPAANAMRYNYTERNSGGTVINYAANLMQVYGDGKIVFSPVASGVSTAVKVLINTSTDAGYTLDVNGTTRIQGAVNYNPTNTAAGTTGNQTINKASGTVNIAAAGTTVTVTNSLVTTSSIVYAVVRTNDATAVIKNVVPGAGSFVINLEAATTAETSIGFFVIN